MGNFGREKKKYVRQARQDEAEQLSKEYHKSEEDKVSFRKSGATEMQSLQRQFKLFKRRQTVLDLGCSPGGWTQVAVNETEAGLSFNKSLVIGVDVKATRDIIGATFLTGLDFRDEEAREKIEKLVKRRKVDVLLHDMASIVEGDDREVVELHYLVLDFAKKVLAPKASMVMRVYDCREMKSLRQDVSDMFDTFEVVQNDFSDSKLFVAKGFKTWN